MSPARSASSSSAHRAEEAEAEQGAGQVQQRLQQVGPPLVTHAKATKAEQPGERALDRPPMPAQLLAGVDPASGDAWRDTPSPQGLAETRGVVRLVGVELGLPVLRVGGALRREVDADLNRGHGGSSGEDRSRAPA
jgi:hypothetical protein